MPPRQNESYVIKPAAPIPAYGGCWFCLLRRRSRFLWETSTAAAAEKGTIP